MESWKNESREPEKPKGQKTGRRGDVEAALSAKLEIYLQLYSRTSVIGTSIIGTIRYLAQIFPDDEIASFLYRALIL